MRIAFIGLGSIAQKHITAIKKIELNTTFYAVRHQDNAIPLEGIENTQLNRLASLNLDAIILSNPSVYHSKFIEELAPLGIPLMVEKPICTSLKQWEALGCLDPKKLPIIYTACNLRFHPLIQFLKNYLEEKKKIYMRSMPIVVVIYPTGDQRLIIEILIAQLQKWEEEFI